MARTTLATCYSNIVCAWANRDAIITCADVEVSEGHITGAAEMYSVSVFAVTGCPDFEVVDDDTLAVVKSDMKIFAVLKYEVADSSSDTPHKAHRLDSNKECQCTMWSEHIYTCIPCNFFICMH